MNLQEPQASEFWKMYNAYEIERKALGNTRLHLLNDYAMHIETLSPEKANEIALATLKNNEAYQKLYTKYYKKAKKILGPSLQRSLSRLKMLYRPPLIMKHN
jgi:hypothetical protein